MLDQDKRLLPYWQKLAVILPSVSIILSILLSYLVNVSWNRDDCVNVILIVGLPLALGLALVRFRVVPAFAGFMTISSLVIGFSMIGAALALLGTRSPAPIADSWLAAADNLLPVSALDIVIGSVLLPEWAIWALRKSYVQTGLYLYVSAVALLLGDREVMAWRLYLIWGWSFFVVSLLAFGAPALGCFSQVAPEQAEHLPKAAGRYAMRTFQDFRSAERPELALGRVSGVITFPSFHVICALVFAQAWHGIRLIGIISKALAGVIIISCVPIGGHYLVDLAAGAVVWWGVTLAIDHLGRTQVAGNRNAAVAMPTA